LSLPGLTGNPLTSEFILTLKGNGFADMHLDVLALVLFMLVAMGLALYRFRKTLD